VKNPLLEQSFRETPLAELKVHPRNARKGNVSSISESIEHNGFFGACVAQVSTGHILVGNHRFLAAREQGMETVPVLWADVDNARAVKILLADNRTNDLAGYDNKALTELLSDISNTDGLDGTGYDEADLDALIAELAVDGAGAGSSKEAPEPKLDKADELREKWGTERGQIWEIGRHRVYCGDGMGHIERATVFDPPWEMDIDAGVARPPLVFTDGRRFCDAVRMFGPPDWVFTWDCVSSWYTPNRPLQRAKYCLFYGDIGEYNFDGSHYGDSGDVRHVSNTRGDYVFTPDPRGKHLSDVYQTPITKLHHDGLHPHEKPADWVRMLIANCTEGLVVDPFGGSGVTAVVCEQIQRPSETFEIEPKYVAVTLQRIADMGLEPKLIHERNTP
jgi:hypothetical protein